MSPIPHDHFISICRRTSAVLSVLRQIVHIAVTLMIVYVTYCPHN